METGSELTLAFLFKIYYSETEGFGTCHKILKNKKGQTCPKRPSQFIHHSLESIGIDDEILIFNITTQ